MFLKNWDSWENSWFLPFVMLVFTSLWKISPVLLIKLNYSYNAIDPENAEESVGEISVQIDLFSHPGTGEHKVNVKGKPFRVLILLLI